MLHKKLYPLPFFSILLFTITIFTPNLIIAEHGGSDTLGYKILDIKKGDRCIVCDIKLKEGKGIALLFNGKRVTVDLDHLHEFLTNPKYFLAKIQTNVALYSEDTIQYLQISYAWFIFGIWVITALIASAFSSNIALRKGLNCKQWFYIGFATNIFGLFFLIFFVKKQNITLPEKLGKIPLTDAPVICSKCGQYNHPSATECDNCKSGLKAVYESEINKL